MSDFLQMAESVKRQAEVFLDAEGIAHDTPVPEWDENRTQGDLVAAPMPQDKILAALLILRTVRELSICSQRIAGKPIPVAELSDICKMEILNNPVDVVGELMYRLRMYQDAMHSDKIRNRYMGHQRGIPRKKGKDRPGTAAWLADRLTTKTRTVDDVLDTIAESPSAKIEGGLPMELHKPRGGLAENGHFSNDYILRFHFGNEWRQVKVKSLRAAVARLRKEENSRL